MSEQTEVITWRKFPENKPNSTENLICTSINTIDVDFYFEEDGEGHFDCEEDGIDVIAFADMPEGWKEE